MMVTEHRRAVLRETTFRRYSLSKFNVVVYAQANNTFQATTNPLLVTSNIQALGDKGQDAFQFSAFHVPRLNSMSHRHFKDSLKDS